MREAITPKNKSLYASGRLIPVFFFAIDYHMKFACALTLVLSTIYSTEAETYLQAGRVFDAVSDATREKVTIVISGNTIQSIEEGYLSGDEPDDTVIKLHDKTVLPGLFDMHIHLASEYSSRSYAERFFLNPADLAYRAAANARKTLAAGFTTIRDLGDRHNVTISLRKAISKGLAVGPRIYAAGTRVATTGGHADPTNGICYHLMGHSDPANGIINGPYEAREAIRQRYKEGSDLIKITASGGVLSLARSGKNPQVMDDELAAIIETAADYNFTVAVHAHGDEAIRRSILAGADSIEHGTLMSEETMKLMAKHGTYLVPTISAGKWVTEKSKQSGFFPESVQPKAAEIGPKAQGTFQRANELGVKIAYGTDTGVSEHGLNAQEFKYMVEAGMPPIEALRSATIEAAKLLKIEDTLGSIEAGKLADIIAVNGDPLIDITNMETVSFVMKDGMVYKNESP